MIAGFSYEQTRLLFEESGIGARKRRPLATNFSELQYALEMLGIETKLRRWGGWREVGGMGIVAVNSSPGSASRNWHWVAVERHPTMGVTLYDPGDPIPCYQLPPWGWNSRQLAEYEPRKSWIEVLSKI